MRLRSFRLHPTPRTPRVVGTEVPCAESLVALRPDYRAMLLGRRTSQGDIRRQRQGPDNRIIVIARFGEMPLANATPVDPCPDQ